MNLENQNEIHTLRQHIANLRDTVYSIGLAIDSVSTYSLTPAKPLYDVIHALEGEIAEYNTQLEYLLNL
jgi:hypothetical protein